MPLAQIVDISQVESLFDVSAVSPWDPFFAFLAIVLGVIAGRILRLAVRRYGKKNNLAPNLIDLFGTIGLWAIVSLSILIALSLVGFNAAPIWLMVLFLGILFVVSGRGFLENFGAGVLLQSRSPFVPGDEINTDGIIGRVKEVNSRVVVIQTIDGQHVSVPNASVLRNPIVNLTHHPYRMSTLDVSVVYSTDLELATHHITTALAGADGVLEDPAPVAEVASFDDSAIRFAARFWHEAGILDERAAIHAAALSLATELRSAGIEFAFPQLTLWQGKTDPRTPNA